MRRRAFIAGLGGAAAWPLIAGAQTKTPHYRIGHLAIAAPTDNPPPPPANWAGFVQGLGEAGYLEGQNISFEHRSALGRGEAPGACGRRRVLFRDVGGLQRRVC